MLTSGWRRKFVDEIHEPDNEGRMVQLAFPRPPLWRASIGSLVGCSWCMGIWVAAALVAGWHFIPAVTIPVSIVLAVAGIGILIEMITLYCKVHSYSLTPAQLARLNESKKLFEPDAVPADNGNHEPVAADHAELLARTKPR